MINSIFKNNYGNAKFPMIRKEFEIVKLDINHITRFTIKIDEIYKDTFVDQFFTNLYNNNTLNISKIDKIIDVSSSKYDFKSCSISDIVPLDNYTLITFDCDYFESK